MKVQRVKKKAVTRKSRNLEVRRARQRAVCHELLKRWVPVAASEALAVSKKGRNGEIIDEEPLEAGLKAGALVLKLLERLSKLDGLDTEEKPEPVTGERVDLVELARRVKTVSPVLAARLRQERPLNSPPPLE